MCAAEEGPKKGIDVLKCLSDRFKRAICVIKAAYGAHEFGESFNRSNRALDGTSAPQHGIDELVSSSIQPQGRHAGMIPRRLLTVHIFKSERSLRMVG